MRFRFGIAWQLAFVVLALIVLVQWASFRASSQLLGAIVADQEIAKIATVGRVVDSLIRHESEDLANIARLIAARDSVAAAMQLPAAERAVRLARLLRLDDTPAIDELEIVDISGVVVYRAQDPTRAGDISGIWGVEDALAGKGTLASATSPAGVTVYASEPLRAGTSIVGAVVVGLHFDDEFLRGLSQQVGTDLAFLSRTSKVVAANPGAADRIDRRAVAEAFRQKIPVYDKDPAARLTYAYLPVLVVDEAYVVLVRQSSEAAYRTLDAAVWQWARIAAIILALSVAATATVLWWMLRPLHRLRRKAERIALTTTGAPIPEASGNEVASAVSVLDILTDRLVAHNEELADAKRSAEVANDAKSRFLSNMSHEIRTPLNGILGMAELLGGTPLTDEQARYCRAIRTSGMTLRDLLGDVLDLAKIEAGKIVLEEVAFDPRELANDAADVFRETASARGSALDCIVDDAVPGGCAGDPVRLRQVLLNLIGNAVKFTDQGSVTVEVTRCPPRDGDERAWLRFGVRDTGIGIDPAARAELFKPFVQADASTTRNFGGSGLGLAISRQLVTLMGGTIDVASEPGRGSYFWFEVPLATTRSDRPPAFRLPAAPQRIAASVLVAEDNPVNQEVIGSLLRRIGATVTVVGNGVRALEAVRQGGPFDLVLMDCQMPTMDGYEATARLRAEEPPGRHLPVIALTANAFAADRERCLAVGMDDYLAKPVNANELALALARWVPAGAGVVATPSGSAAVDAATTAGPGPEAAAGQPAARIGSAPAPAAETGSPPLLDPAALAALVEGIGADRVRRVISVYLATANDTRAALERQLQAGDLDALRKSLHGLKSSTLGIGGLRLGRLAAELEAAAGAGSAETLVRMPEVFAELDAFCAAIASHAEPARSEAVPR